MSTFYLDGVDVADYGIRFLHGSNYEDVPSVRTSAITIPGRPGAYHFGSELEPRMFSLKCAFVNEADHLLLQTRIRQMGRWLTDAYGRPKSMQLSFSDESDKYYDVVYSDAVDVERIHRLGFFTLNFIAHNPTAKSVVTSDQIVMDSDTPILSDLLWDTGVSSRLITSPDAFTVVNNGSLAMRFSFIIKGSGNSVTISANGRTFSLGNFADKTIEVDGEAFTVRVNGISDLTSTGGDFVELMPGLNEVSIGGNSLNFTISESLRYEYV